MPKPTIKEIEPLVSQYKGNIAAIARHCGVSRGTIYNRMKDSATLTVAIEDAKESRKDFAESQLDKAIDEGNITAIIFFLKTQAKDRGYIERQEHTGADGKDLTAIAYITENRPDDS